MTQIQLYNKDISFITKMKYCINYCLEQMENQADTIVLGTYFYNRLNSLMEYSLVEIAYIPDKEYTRHMSVVKEGNHPAAVPIRVHTKKVNRLFLFGLIVEQSNNFFELNIK